MNKKFIAIIIGKREKSTFNRYSFPILGRPVAAYPLEAALSSPSISKIYLSTDSLVLKDIGSTKENVIYVERGGENNLLIDDIKSVLELHESNFGRVELVSILFANSPCILPAIIENSVSFLIEHKEYDSVSTVMKRSEFHPYKAFQENNVGDLLRLNDISNTNMEIFYLDHRMVTVRADILKNVSKKTNYIEDMLGIKTYPFLQDDGIWDIDYPWQVPAVELWLKKNGINENELPFQAKKDKRKVPVIGNEIKKNRKLRVLVTTVPFGEIDRSPLDDLLSEESISVDLNPIGRKLKEEELVDLVKSYDILIAGTESITCKVMENGNNLKLIARVGIGLDNVDLNCAKEKGIIVTYTPDAPAPAVAELTVAHMLNLLRRVPFVDRKIRSGIWQRYSGERLANMTIGIIGTGRVGKRVLRHIQSFSPKNILVNDIAPDYSSYSLFQAREVSKEEIYAEADLISLHLPLKKETRNMITKKELSMMKKNCMIINTSRGGIINEYELYEALRDSVISAGALDVFEVEPYSGNLLTLDNCFITCHMGSMTNDCRSMMEIQATEDVLRFVRGQELKRVVPQDEYSL